MSNPSNLYAEKIFAEHPLALWALDDQLDYISLISEEQRDIDAHWSITNASTYSGAYVTNEPFSDSVTTVIKCDVPQESTMESTFISQNLKNFSELNKDQGTFCVGTHFYSESVYLKSVSIGYEYTDTTSSNVVQHVKTFETDIVNSWIFISETFAIPDEITEFRTVIKIVTKNGGSTSDDYVFYVNGITVGQWSEEFNVESLGISPLTIPNTVSVYGESSAVEAKVYGTSENSGYYLLSPNLLAKNTSIPLVYGASNVTRLEPNDGPSLIIPGQGFLNNSGRYKEYTVEFWARINSDAYTSKRIFGPIASNDGLYIDRGFLTLVIGSKFASHFVGEWYRPMLIHIRVIKNSISLLLNGEEVISFNINQELLTLPDELDQDGKNQDWLGFYSYSDISPYEIDCVAIYSYQVPINVAKRRWVYGQGVRSAESINASYNGESAFIDYPFAKYTANYSYPNFAKWEQATFDNLNTTSLSLTTPQYSLPEIATGSLSLQSLYDANKNIQSGTNPFITFRPNSEWNSQQCYINFPKFNIINDEVHSIYGVFESANLTSEETLIKIYNPLNGNYFSIRKDSDHIDYYLMFNGEEQEILLGEEIVENEKFAVGINIQKMADYFGGNVVSFFGNRNGLKIYVAGDENNTYSFTGKMYSFGVSSSVNAQLMSNHFGDTGAALINSAEELLAHTASYTLLPSNSYESFFLDIGVNGIWEDYMPLSYFAKYIKNDKGSDYYDLDFLQFNIDYPAPSKITEQETVSSWLYSELESQYSLPIQQTYSQLDNFFFSGWHDYLDMSQKSLKSYEYSTQNASVRSYITFQYIQDGANALQETFTSVESPKEGGVIDIDLYPSWQTTKFEVVNNTIIYPSKTIDFNKLAIVYRLEFNVRGTLTGPVSIKKLEIASQALNNNSFNPIGTRFGKDLFPYKKSGLYYDYKSKNPFSIYKGSTPYLYLTNDSGIKVRGEFEKYINRGISFPVNTSKASEYKVNAIQFWAKYDEKIFPGTETEIFNIVYKGDTIKFYIVADSQKGNRGTIFAKNETTGSSPNGLMYYINGKVVRELKLGINEWSVVGISFATPLNFDAYMGSIDINGPLLFNNLSYYKENDIQKLQKFINRTWIRVKNDGYNDLEWQYWIDNYIWDEVLVISSSSMYGTNPSDIYRTYTGTNKIIIDDNMGMSLNADTIKAYNDISWQSTTKIPV